MKILAFDTSTAVAVASPCGDGDALASSATSMPGRRIRSACCRWSTQCSPKRVSRSRDLDGIAFGAGPGAFTGVRIACGVAQGLALGAERPARSRVARSRRSRRRRGAAHGATRVLACLDARMREVYVAGYRRRRTMRWESAMRAPSVLLAADVAPPAACAWFGAGDGFAAYPELAARLGAARASTPPFVPQARAIAELALPRVGAGRARGRGRRAAAVRAPSRGADHGRAQCRPADALTWRRCPSRRRFARVAVAAAARVATSAYVAALEAQIHAAPWTRATSAMRSPPATARWSASATGASSPSAC